MAPEREQRRLTTILAADVAGYSRLTAVDEEGTLKRLRALRAELIDPTITGHGGRIFKTNGDSVLAEFASVVDAARCAVAIQRGLEKPNATQPPTNRILFRIGIHLGDVVAEPDGDLMGDGVNIAARLEGISEPGGISLSRAAHEQVRGKIDAAFTDLGDVTLKNMATKVRMFRWQAGGAKLPPVRERRTVPLGAILSAVLIAMIVGAGGGWYFFGREKAAPAPVATNPAAPEPLKLAAARLSIVVLPFANLSGDPAQDYLADVLSDELTTYISRIPDSFVIARNTAFTYKDKPTDVRQIGKDLGVRYALEGSVQATATRIRVNAQLIDTDGGAHLWAESFDNEKTDLLQTEDEIVTRLARTLQIQMTQVEVRKRSSNPEADDLAMQCEGMFLAVGTNRNDTDKAYSLCEQALEKDGKNIRALAILAYRDALRVIQGQSLNPVTDVAAADDMIGRALANEADNGFALYVKGVVLIAQKRDDQAIAMIERALAADPVNINCYAGLWNANLFSGRPEKAIEYPDRAIRLSPRDALLYEFYFEKGYAFLMMGQDDKAIEWLRRSVATNPDFPNSNADLAAALALDGKDDEARKVLAHYLALPRTRIKTLAAFAAQRASDNPRFLATRERLADGLRKAGMAEQ